MHCLQGMWELELSQAEDGLDGGPAKVVWRGSGRRVMAQDAGWGA